MSDLNARQKLFVESYCGPANCIATDAARLAGYQGENHVLAITASRLLKKPAIRRAIDDFMTDHSMSAGECIARLTAIARSSIGDLIDFDESGNPGVHLTPDNIQEVGPLVHSIECDKVTGRVVRVKLHDSLGALRTLARIRNLYSDAPVINVDLGGVTDEELVERIRARRTRLQENNGRTAPEQAPWQAEVKK